MDQKNYTVSKEVIREIDQESIEDEASESKYSEEVELSNQSLISNETKRSATSLGEYEKLPSHIYLKEWNTSNFDTDIPEMEMGIDATVTLNSRLSKSETECLDNLNDVINSFNENHRNTSPEPSKCVASIIAKFNECASSELKSFSASSKKNFRLDDLPSKCSTHSSSSLPSKYFESEDRIFQSLFEKEWKLKFHEILNMFQDLGKSHETRQFRTETDNEEQWKLKFHKILHMFQDLEKSNETGQLMAETDHKKQWKLKFHEMLHTFQDLEKSNETGQLMTETDNKKQWKLKFHEMLHTFQDLEKSNENLKSKNAQN